MRIAAEAKALNSEMDGRELTITISDQQAKVSNHSRKSSQLGFIGVKSAVSNCSRVFGIFLLSTLAITTARILAPFEVGKDQSVQLEAAQRLADGLGLTTTNQANSPFFDISESPVPGYLSQWPPGFSIIVAGFLLTGLPLLASLKIIYGVTTLVGWLGWATLASYLTSAPIRLGTRNLNIHFFAAAILPIFTTPLWNGTDIFLWACIPFVVLLLNKTSTEPRSNTALVSAGLLFGFACAMRYASAFLALAALLILIQVSYPRVTPFLRRLLVFSLPSLAIAGAIFVYIKISSLSPSGLPARLTATSEGLTAVPAKVQAILNGSSVTSNLIFGFPLLDWAVTKVNSRPLSYGVGASCLLIIFSLPLIVLRSRASTATKPQADLALSLSFLPLSLTAFLILTKLLSDSSLFKIRRYYEPVILCSIFIFYELASKRAAHRIVRHTSIAIVFLFIAYTMSFNSGLLLIPERRDQLVQSVLAFTPARGARQHSTSLDLDFPSRKLYSWKESSRLKVKQLYEAHPEALFIAQEYPLFVYDGFRGGGPVPGLELICYPGATYLKQAHTSKPIKVFWVLASATTPDFIRDSDLKLIHFDPVEKTSIYESDLPAGYKFLGDKQ